MKISTLALVAIAACPAGAQWIKLPTDGIPRADDGKVNMNAPAPRRPDGKPDLSGIWNPTNTKYLNNLAADLKPGELQMLPWADALVKERSNNLHGAEESDARCLPPGIPKINAAPNPIKIIQEPKLIVLLYETFDLHRQFFMDGREPRRDANPTWLGYSTAKWDGDSLVVDTTGLNNKAWLDKAGHPITESMHVTERYRRLDFGHMETVVTIDDAAAYAKPWSVAEHFELLPNTELFEDICENEKDIRHMPGK